MMSVEFNHTILPAKDAEASAAFLAKMLALPGRKRWSPFWMATTDNGVSLDYMDVNHRLAAQHYAFLVDDKSFDGILFRIEKAGLNYWVDPDKSTLGLNRHDDGSGLYFDELNGHLLEVITRPYGSGRREP